jgi:hypothetical protein
MVPEYNDNIINHMLMEYDYGDTIELICNVNEDNIDGAKGILLIQHPSLIYLYVSDKMFFSGENNEGLLMTINTDVSFNSMTIETTRMVLTEKYILGKRYPHSSEGYRLMCASQEKMLQTRSKYRKHKHM